jgi:5-methylcytosine-specific restriction endonuclease McrA
MENTERIPETPLITMNNQNEYKKLWRKMNREKIIEYNKLRKDKNREYYQHYMKLPGKREQRNLRGKKFHESPKGIYHIIKTNSKNKERDFNLTQLDFIHWYRQQKRFCFYCKIPESKLYLLPIKNRLLLKRLTIDRPDNTKGYALDNMVLACPLCNKIKSDILTKEEMQKVAKLIISPKWKDR